MTTLDNFIVYSAVFGVGGTVLFLLAKLFLDAANTLESEGRRFATLISIGVISWAILSVIYAYSIGLSFPKLIPMLVIPWTLGLLAMFSAAGSRMLRKIPVHRLIALSTYRIAGLVFIYCYYCCGTLSRGFALNAGWGDVLTGVLAIPTAILVKRGTGYSYGAFALWTVIGIGDLILAPASAAIFGPEKLTDFPINLIPLFLGPPFGILLHLITVRAYLLQTSEATKSAA
jgi:hypothetical protein